MTDGRLVLMGSGEIAPTMVGVHRAAMEAAGTTGVTILDSPFGFQENVEVLTDRLVEFFETSLVAEVSVARLRSTGEAAVARERALALVRRSRFVFAGPGSPSYALKVWREAGMGDALQAVLSAGGSVTLASAAAVTAGALSIPVYEIYKVGEDPFWLQGLDLVSRFGLDAVVVPHWNNTEGGNHDTSRCYIGERRLRILEEDLNLGILGIDEHTAATIDFGRGTLEVAGRGSVTVRGGSEVVLATGTTIGLDEVIGTLGSARASHAAPPGPGASDSFVDALADGDVDGVISAMLDAEADPAKRAELRSMIVELGEAARAGLVDPRDIVSGFVDLLLSLRASARDQHRYEESDLIRDRLADLGVEIRDTPTGQEWV